MDTSQPFSYVFDDPNWISKVIIGGVLGITGILYPSLVGYLVDTARNVRDGVPQPMPQWGEDFGGRWVRGLSLSVLGLVYFIIVALPFICLGAGLGAALGASSSSPDAAAGIFSGTLLALFCAMLPASLIVSLVYPAIMIHYVNRGTFVSGFEFGAIWQIMSRDWDQYLLAWLLYIVASFISGVGASICIGVIFTMPYAMLIIAHLIGQLAQGEPAAGTLRPEF
jgi:hypothetical protein